MKTVFQLGFPTGFDFWAGQAPVRPFLGQAVPTGDLDEATKNAVYARLKGAIDRGMEIDNWIHAQGEAGQRAAFGADYDTWRGYINSAGDLAVDVYPIYQRLGSDNMEDWWIVEADAPKVTALIDTVNSAYAMFQKMRSRAGAPVAAPQIQRMGPTGAPVAPSSRSAIPAGAAAAAKPILPPSGPSTNDILIGGGLAVGLGIALYALM